MIYLLRHGETQYNLENRFLGQSDVGLAHQGKARFQAIAKQLKQKQFTAIYCSKYQRSQETAQILSAQLNIPVFVCPDLGECHLGTLDGQKKSSLVGMANLRQLMDLSFAPPEGESGADCLHRFTNVLNTIALGAKGNILVISHGGIIALYLKHVLNASQNCAFLDHGFFHLLAVNKQGKISGKKLNQQFMTHLTEDYKEHNMRKNNVN